jgi:hypothetical protein
MKVSHIKGVSHEFFPTLLIKKTRLKLPIPAEEPPISPPYKPTWPCPRSNESFSFKRSVSRVFPDPLIQNLSKIAYSS